MKRCLHCNDILMQWSKEPNYLFVKRRFCHKGHAKTFNAGSPLDRLYKNSIPEPNSGCWLWLLSVDHHGYGQININGKYERANRLSWRVFYGAIPAGLLVLHKCDMPCCVNPEHLFLGTDLDNNRDMHKKKRHVQFSGEKLPQSKLTEASVREIRASTADTMTLARKYGVSRSTIRSVVRLITWKEA